MLIDKKADALALKEAEALAETIKIRSKSLEDIAEDPGYQLHTAKDISSKGYIEEIGISDSFAKTAFSLLPGEVGGPCKTQYGYAIVRLDKLTPVDMDKFQADKETFAAELTNEKKTQSFEGWFLELKAKANMRENI